MAGHIQGRIDGTASAAGLVGMIDTYDRPEKYEEKGCYKYANDYVVAGFKDKPGQRIPKLELSAGAGVGLARFEDGIVDAEVKGPNAAAGVKASLVNGAEVFAKAELASASASVGPLKVKAGISADTGASVSLTHVEARFLGTGFAIGHRMEISLFGTGFGFNLW